MGLLLVLALAFLIAVLAAWALLVGITLSDARRRREPLEDLARLLHQPRREPDHVAGQFHGFELRVGLDGAIELQVPHAAAEFDLARASALERLQGHDQQARGLVVRRGGGAALEALFQEGEVLRAATALLTREECERLELRQGWLRFVRRHPRLDPPYVLGVGEQMVAVARACMRKLVRVRERAGQGASQRFAWTGGGERTCCPYCRDDLQPEADDVVACAACGTLHHRECLEEARRCTVFGCRGRAGTERVRA